MIWLSGIERREDGWMFAILVFEPIVLPFGPRTPFSDESYESRVQIAPTDYARLKPLVGKAVEVRRYGPDGRFEIVAAGSPSAA